MIDVDHLDVSLDNTDITLRQVDVSKKGRFSARISGQLDAAKRTGDLNAAIDTLSYKSADSELLLENPQNAPLVVNYHMRPDGDSIEVAASSWRAGGHLVTVGEFTTPFSHQNWSGKLPPTAVTISPWLKAKVSGEFNRQPPYASLDISLFELTYDSWRVNQPEDKIKLVIGDDISVITKNNVIVASDKTTINLMPVHMSYADKQLRIHRSGIKIAGQSFPNIKGQIDLNRQTGSFTLEQLNVIDNTGMNLLAVDKPVSVELSLRENNTDAEIPMLGVKFYQHKQSGWSVAVDDFGKLNKYSPLMQRYQLEEGKFTLVSDNGSQPWSFNGKIKHPLALLVDGDTPVHDYHFSGNYDGNKTTAYINEKIHLQVTEKVSIDSKEIGYNLPALLSLINAPDKQKNDEKRQGAGKSINRKNLESGHPAKESKKAGSSLSLALTAKDSFIYIDETHRAMAEELNLTLDKGTIECDLKYDSGKAVLEIKDDKISLAGKEFGPGFVNEIINYSKFSKGELEFEVSGGLENLDAVIVINDAVINDFGLASNILAFINTVPALLTFKLPGFHTEGLHASKITAGLNYQDGLIKLKAVHLDSKEIDVRGDGNVNMNDDTIDVTLNLITGAKKNLSHIPLLGYVLSGKEKKPSITLTVKGDMHNPEISHTAFREVATYPFQLLKRTVILPAHVVNKVRANTDGNSSDASNTEKQ